MNPRAALIFLVLGFIGLLIVMGAMSLVRWMKAAYPHRFRSILVALCLLAAGLGLWGYMEVKDRPAFHTGDLLTLEEPVVARLVASDRHTPDLACIVAIYEHLAVVEAGSGTLTARVESNNKSGPSYCPIGTDVQIELAWLHRFTLTHRQS